MVVFKSRKLKNIKNKEKIKLDTQNTNVVVTH